MNKRIVTFILLWLICFFGIIHAENKNRLKGVRVFINPGHGGYDSDDRHMETTDFWESEGNLIKAFSLKDLLESEKATVFLSRTENRTVDDLDFNVINEMANASNADLFISIHSNGGNGQVNRPMVLYRGYDKNPIFQGAKDLSQIVWQELYKNGNNWTHPEPYTKGDWSFYTDWGKQGLGVLRNLTIPGMLTEGSFHDYVPESWRLKNPEFLRHEAWAIFRAMKVYYEIEKASNGIAAGIIRNQNKKATWKIPKNATDIYQPIENAVVKLEPGGKTYTTDTQKNGFYYFEDLEPGTYFLEVSDEQNLKTDTATIEIKAGQTTLTDFHLKPATANKNGTSSK